jgi:hypothetical protein
MLHLQEKEKEKLCCGHKIDENCTRLVENIPQLPNPLKLRLFHRYSIG